MQGKAKATALLLVALSVGGLFLSSGCGSSEKPCTIGSTNCACTAGLGCDPGLACIANKCVGGGSTGGAGGMSGATGGAGGMSAGTGGAPASTDPEVICTNVSATCAKLNECAPLLVQLLFGDMANCVARYKIACKDGVLAPDSGLTLATVNACAAALPAGGCDALLYRQIDACNFKGKRGNGAACGTNEQCQTGYCATGDALCGVCATQVGAGQNCTADEDCMAGMVCSDDAHCVLPSGGGLACSATQPCRYGFYCRNGSCAAAQMSAGQNCQDEGSCLLLKGIACNTTLQTCAKIGSAGPGETCGLVGNSFTACAAGACRYADSTATQGLCSSLAKDGEQCGSVTTNNVECQFPARCSSNRCKLPSSAACL